MTWWRGIAFSVVVAFGVVYWMGSRLPVEHHAVATGRVGASQDKVWSLVSDTATQAQWRTGDMEDRPCAPGGQRTPVLA